MLLSAREAVKGQDYVTAKTRIRVTFRGEAPKRSVTAPPMFLLYSHATRNELTVPGNYDLETLDAESPLLGTAPSLDAFALQSVAWARDHVGQLSDADLEALAATDSRPGVQSAVASEVARRLEAKRGEAEAIPSGAMAVGTPARELALPDGGSGISITLPPRDDGQPHPAGMGAPVPLSELMVRVNHFFAEAIPAPTPEPSQSASEPVAPASEEFAPAEPDWLGIDPAEPETSSQSGPQGEPPAELAEALPPAPTGDPLTPPDEGIAAAFPDAVPDEVGARVEVARAFLAAADPVATEAMERALTGAAREAIAATFPEPYPPGAVYSAPGVLEVAPYPTAREADDIPWPPHDEAKSSPPELDAKPTPTRRVRRSSADSELAAKLSASEAEASRLRGELTESAATVSELRRLLEEAGAALGSLRRDYNAAAKGRAEALADVERLTDSAEDLISQLARTSLDVTAAVKRAEVAEAEVDHLRAVLAERAPMPATLSPEGRAKAEKVSGALRQLADAYPWTVAAEEARTRLNLAGIRSPGA